MSGQSCQRSASKKASFGAENHLMYKISFICACFSSNRSVNFGWVSLPVVLVVSCRSSDYTLWIHKANLYMFPVLHNNIHRPIKKHEACLFSGANRALDAIAQLAQSVILCSFVHHSGQSSNASSKRLSHPPNSTESPSVPDITLVPV